MIIVQEMGIREFKAWSYATDTKNKIIECDRCEEFDSLIEELYPEGLTGTQLNDILWHDSDWVYETLGINEDDSE